MIVPPALASKQPVRRCGKDALATIPNPTLSDLPNAFSKHRIIAGMSFVVPGGSAQQDYLTGSAV